MAAVLITALLLFAAGVPSAAKDPITETVNMMQVNQNTRGEGYYWHNPSDKMTLTDVYIDTADEFGLKMPDKSYLVLEGNNYIRASKAALFCEGELQVSGTGSLTLVSDEGIGVLINTTKAVKSVRFIGGNIVIKAGAIGVQALYATASFSNCTVDITTKGENAVTARILLIGGCPSFKANATLSADYKMNISASALEVTGANGAPALVTPDNFTVNDIAMSAGADIKSVSAVEEYAGQTALVTKSTVSGITPSIIFGEGVSVAVDILIIIGFLAVIAAVIAVPAVRYRRRIAAIKAGKSEAKKQAKAAAKAKAKAGKKREEKRLKK